MKPNTKNYKET